MLVLLPDADVTGQVECLILRMQTEPWLGFWNYLQVSSVSFADVGLDPSDSDAVVWQRCQDKGFLLITNNRNDDSPDSLENTIRTRNTPTSLPVFTISDAKRLLGDRDYVAEVIWRLLENLFDLDNLRGTGRLYLP